MRRAGRKDLRRNAGSRSEHRRVFVSSEGYKTEVQYMRELLRQSEILGLHGRVEVVILNRYETDSGLSHPDQVIGMTADYMEFLSSDRCSVGLFLSKVLDSAGNPGGGPESESCRETRASVRCAQTDMLRTWSVPGSMRHPSCSSADFRSTRCSRISSTARTRTSSVSSSIVIPMMGGRRNAMQIT